MQHKRIGANETRDCDFELSVPAQSTRLPTGYNESLYGDHLNVAQSTNQSFRIQQNMNGERSSVNFESSFTSMNISEF